MPATSRNASASSPSLIPSLQHRSCQATWWLPI